MDAVPIHPENDSGLSANWLTVKQAAEYAKVSTGLVYQWVKTSALPHYRLGAGGKRGCIRVDPGDLIAFLKSCRVERAEGPHRQPPPTYTPRHFTLD